jgi:hypothetical protein
VSGPSTSSGRRLSIIAVTGGVLLLLLAGLAFREPLVERWHAFLAEREAVARVQRKLAEVHTVQFQSGAPLKDVILTLSALTSVEFSWGGDGQPRNYPVPAFQLERRTLKEILEQALGSINGHAFRYTVSANGVLVEEVGAKP